MRTIEHHDLVGIFNADTVTDFVIAIDECTDPEGWEYFRRTILVRTGSPNTERDNDNGLRAFSSKTQQCNRLDFEAANLWRIQNGARVYSLQKFRGDGDQIKRSHRSIEKESDELLRLNFDNNGLSALRSASTIRPRKRSARPGGGTR